LAIPIGVYVAIPNPAKGFDMVVCQWSLDILYGKQREALAAMKAWGEEKFKSSGFRKSRNRVMVGYIGESASHVVDEYTFDSLADFEMALADMGQPQFKRHSEALAPFIVPGSQKWTVYRVVE